MKTGKVIIVIGVLLLFLCTALSGGAEIRPGSYTLTPSVGGYLFEGNQDLKHRPVYGLGFGYSFDEHWGAEAVFNFIDTESDGNSGDVKGYLYRLNGLYHFNPFGDLMPYIAAGVGAITLDPDRGGSDTDPLVNYGVGLKYFFSENIALQGDVRHVISFDDTYNNLIYTLGVTFYFGGAKRAEAVPFKDSDGDGVPDYLDQCPGTPKGATVNEVGCWVCKGLEFDFDKWDIKPQYYPVLDEAIACMNQHPGIRVEIQGHTCDTGTAEYNQILSEKRAREVMNYFIKKGIAEERLSAVGHGLTQPIASNKTREGRAKNRRVQLKPIY